MKKQRFLALFLAVMMIFSSFLPQTAIAFADTSAESPAASSSDEGVTTTSGAGTVVTPPDGEGGVGDIFEKDFIRVRIEGTNQTLYDDEVEIDLDTNITPLDVLKLAIGEDNIGGSTGSYGYFISSLMSEDQSDQLYWMYKTVDLSDHFQTIWDSVDSHTGLVNDDGELQVNELVFYKSYYKELSSSNIMQTVAPRVTESNEGHVFTFTLVNDETPSEVIEGAVFTLEDGSEYTTSVDGTVEIPLTTAGEQYIKIAKVYHDDDLALDAPLLIRDTISVTSEGSSIVTDTIHLRIEGASETLYDKDLEIALSQDINPKDILIQAIGEDQIEATTTNGYFITGLLGESQQDNLGWSYGVVTNSDNFIYPTVGVDQYDALLDAEGRLQVKELIFYITYYDSTTLYTKMPIITIENDQENFTVTIKSHDAGTPAIEDVTIAISDGRKYNTNALGQATFNLNQASDYTLYIEKYLENETTGQEYPYIIRQTCIVTSPGKNDASVSTAVADILNYYKDKDALTCTEVLAYNHLQTNTSEYITVFKKNDSTNHAGLADNIIGSIATGQDASSYIKALLDAQQEDGSFIVDGEATSSTNLANVILALDMSSASYNVDQAVNKLLSYESDGYFDDVSSTALVLLALASHSESEAVQTVIDSSLDYLAQQQLANGGFDGFDYGNSPYTTGPVIQALVRLEQDFDDSTWKKETRSIIEALLACKIEGNGYDFVEGWNYGDPTATAYAFAALSDYAIGISAYDDFKLPDSSSEIELALKSVINDITIYLNALETRRDSNWVEHPAFFRPLETVALNVSNSDIDSVVDAIAEKFDLNVSEGTLPYAMNIIGLIATGQNADYYVDLLVNNQLNDGSFKVGVVEQTEWAMIALDMANAVYDTEKAVAYILTDNQDEESVALLAPALIALSNHTDIDGVTAFIDDKISYIHTQQLNTGGFETITGYGEDSVATALIVSALIANGINPLKDSNWIKDGKTLFDVLMSYKKLNYFIYNDMYGEYMYKDEATEQVFIAMVDLLNQRSSFSTVQPCKSLNAIAISAYDKVENHLLTSDTRINDSNASENMFYTSYDALALNAGSADKKSLYTQLQTNVIFKGDDSLESLAMNVIASIASGKVLTLTDEKYHEVLMAKQDANGIFSNSLIAQSQAIIALDMADVIYNKTGALQALSQMINDNDSKTVEEICWAIIALSRYQDDSNYEIILDGLVKDLSDAQQNDAGFGDAAKNGLALQALISIGEKATSETWKKGSNSIIEKLIDSQLDDSTFKLDGSTSDSYATGMAILGLVSQITGTSPYLEVTPELDPKDIYKNHIKDLHDYYDQVAQLNYIQASGLYMTNGVKSTLLSKLESRSNEAKRTYIVFDNDVEMIAKDIIGLVGLDENPYAFNGQNFVQTLIATMNEDGVFVKEDTADISSQAYAIIALDMANLDYDTEKAIHQLIELYNTKSQQGKLSVYNVAEAMIALSNHTEMTNVPEAINICKTDLKKMQMSTGGYDYSDGSSSNASEVSEYDAIAIQAIIAVGDDPSSDTYTIDGKNPIDGLLSFKRDKHFIYDESKLSYQVYHESCSGYALAALIDLDNKDSMYHKKHILTPTDQVTTDLDAYWPSYRKNKSNMALLNVELPRKQKEAIEAWKKKLAISWTSGAISTPLIVDDKVYVVCGKTLSVFDKDGNELNTMTLEGSTGYYANFLASGKGLIYAHIGNGKIQAVDAKTLESKWISTIGDGYNTLSPILYEDGYIYTGSGPNASNEGRYVGIKVQDLDPDSATEENAPVWKHESNSGYYWSGGAVVDGVIVFAGDDGQLVSADLKTGQEVDTLALGGQIRNSVVYDSESGKLVIGAKNSKVHAVELKTDGSFDDATYMTADLPAQSTSPVIVYNDRVYIGSGQMSQGSITVLNLNDLSEIYTANVGSGGIQGGLLATTAYGTDANKHQINIYFTRNSNPGGLYMITDYEGNTAAPEVTDIYIPTDKNYCLSSPIADKDGSIYYSNDSGYLFALSFEKEIVLDELDAYWSSYRKNTNNMALLDIKLPENQAQAIEAWKEKLSLDWSAISTPLIVEDKVYVVCGKTLSVFDKDGNTLNSMTLEGSTSWYASFLASGGGLIYAHIGNGKIQAVDAKTLESKWISTIGDGYNTLSPIVYKEGYIYTGSGPNASNEGAYVGIKVQDKDPNSGTEENTPVWRHESSNGYYWSGGAVVDDVIVFAGDDGQLISADLRTGQEVDSLALGGQIRNCVVYDPTSEKVIVSAENSKVHAVALNKDGTFNDTTYMTANLPAASTSPAIVYNGRIYIGSGKTDQGHITVFKLDDLSEIYSATVGSGGIQGGLLATTAYGTDANKQINIYFTRNNNPGGLYMIKDFEGNTTAPEVTDIYIPIDKNYCLSSPIADEDGNIYYSNDSGYLFALTYAPVVESDYDSDKTLQENTEFVYPSGETITFDDITTKEDATFKVQKIDKAIIPQTATVKQSGSVLKVDIGDATLAAPAKLKLPITDMALAEYSSIYYYNETTKAWEYVESTREGKALIASINHFSTYGVLADTTGPKNLFINAMNISENSVTLNFKAYDESPITAYHVYRNDFDNVYKTVTDAALTDTGLVTGTEYNYKIIAEDCFGNKSTLSAVATIVPNKNTSGDGKDEKPSGVPVYMRVVGYDGDIISRKLMYVQNYNLTPYLSEGTGSSTKPSTGWDIDKFPNGASHAHAIESALRQKNISYQFEDYGTGLYLSMINDEKEFDLLGTSGWMYNVNGSLPNVGSEGLSLNDYDDITWYFSAYGYDALFPSIKLSASKIQKEDSLEITLKDIYKKKAISNAVILINGEESPYRTNSEGKATLFFDEDGDYSISAYHKLNGLYDMVHPVPVSLTVGNPKSSGGSGGSSYNGTKETKTPIATQYTEAYAVLRKESTTESEAISSLDNVRDKVYGAMLRANTKEDAIQLSSNAQDAAELIRWSLDKIETPEAAKSTLSYTNDLMSSVAKSTKILAQSDVDQEERSMATASALKAIKANTDNALNTIQLILDKGNGSENMDALVDEFASNVIAVKKNITSAEQEQLDAMMTASAQAFLNAQTEITAETRDDGFVAIFNGISLVDIEALNKQSTELTKKLLEKTGTTPIKTVVPKVVLKVDTDQENQVTAYIDKVSLNNSGLSKASPVIVTTPIGSVELPSEVINASTGNQIKVSLIRVNREDQSPTLKAFIKNDSQVIDVQLSLNRLEKRTFDQPIEVSIPYNAGTDTAHKLVVYHENEDGTFEKFAGVYNEETKMVTFKTPHLSQFFVKPESKNFDDVTTDLWAKKSIERLSALDVINGKDAYNFMPEEKVTRAEFATMLNRLMAAVSDCTESDLTKVTFDDVQNDTWYAENVKSVVAKGWMNGKSSTIFDPNGYITQQEITCVMANILKEQHYLVKIDTQEDSTVANWAQPSVCLVKQLGIMDSLTVRGFLPTEKAQRDEVAVLLDELSKVLIQE